MRHALSIISSSTVLPPSATPSRHHHPRRHSHSTKTKPTPKQNPKPQLTHTSPLLSSSRWDNRQSLMYHTKLASKLAEDGRFEDFLMIVESVVASGVSASEFSALLNSKSVGSGIVRIISERKLNSVVEMLFNGVRNLGIEPVQLFDGVAMELLRGECQRLLKCGEVEQLVNLMDTLSGFQFPIKELVEPSDVIKLCINKKSPNAATRYAQNFPHVEILFCSIILEFGKERDLVSALEAFEVSRQKSSSPNMHAYRAIIDVCGLCGDCMKSRVIYEELLTCNVNPNTYVFNSLMNVNARDLNYTLHIYKQMEVLADAKMWKQALEIKEDMVSSCVIPDTVTWSSLIRACANSGLIEQAIKLFDEMLQAGGQPNAQCLNILLHSCVEACQYDRAFRLFQCWKETGFQQTITDNNPKNSEEYVAVDQVNKTCCVSTTMRVPFRPTTSTYNILMKACGTDYYRAKALMGEMKILGLSPNHISWSILIDICGGSGNVAGAMHILRSMHENGFQPDVITYTTAIKVCVENKNPKLAFSLFVEMKKHQIKPNLVTYNTILRARNRYGSLLEVQQCLSVYQHMRKAGYKPNDYYLKQLIEEWCEGVIQNRHERKDQVASGRRETDFGPESLLLEKVAEHLQESNGESLSIDLRGLTKVEARIVVLAVLRKIKEEYITGNSVKDDLLIILGVQELGARIAKDENGGVREAVMKLLQHDLELQVLSSGSATRDNIRRDKGIPVYPNLRLEEVLDRSGSSQASGSPARRPIILQRLRVTRESLYHWLQRKMHASTR
ncbi:hypothetical protein RD792_011909 [Penstemon davidsonii]|uniref:Pentatricopeptide repeat-containing protein n=1 Tax=Penstemon davidsonii TaxID=160366 RepID=A0ABR0CVX1_9LAMI|nr:hypothetical protein RD792_011909 [Penstemon davidsonii]